MYGVPAVCWVVGDLGGGATIHAASVTSVSTGAGDDRGSVFSFQFSVQPVPDRMLYPMFK